MSDTQSTTPPIPAMEPICTKGSWFWQGEQRFLIKGTSYLPRLPGGKPFGTESQVDPFDEARISELKRDIEIFKEIGLNTIQVSHLDPSKNHGKAMDLLAEAGIYVLVTICDELDTPSFKYRDQNRCDPNFDVGSYYTEALLKRALKVVDELSSYPNALGFTISGDVIKHVEETKMAEVCRAAVRDVKAFLAMRGGRCPPVGISVKGIRLLWTHMLQYFTAGRSQDRVDFFAPGCWSWAHPSDFRISGWESMVRVLEKYPVPMFFAAYGTNVNGRVWEEVGCLYSPYMTGVFSGGCLYTYFEDGSRYGVVELTDEGAVRRKAEFVLLKQQFRMVGRRKQADLYLGSAKDYEHWVGEFQRTAQNRWLATSEAPSVSGGLDWLVEDLKDEQEWELVGKESQSESATSTTDTPQNLIARIAALAVAEKPVLVDRASLAKKPEND